MKKIIIILLVIIFSTCHEKNKRTIYNDNIDEIKISVSDGVLKMSEIIESSDYFLLKTDEEHLIGEITKLESFNNNFYILDSKHAKSVLIYNNRWEFNKSIENHGRGPGEFISPTDFNINKYTKNLEILDEIQQKIIKYDLDGNFINEEVRFQPWGFCFGVINENEYALSSQQIFNGSYPNDLYIVSASGDIMEDHFPNDKRCFLNFSTQTCFYNSSDSLLYKPNYSDTIYSIAKTIKPYLIIDFGKNKLPKDIILDKNDVNELIESNYAYHIENYIESKNYVYFRFSFKKELRHVFYSKKTKVVKYGYNFINDYDGLALVVKLLFLQDKLVCVYPGFVCDFYKNSENRDYFNKLSSKVKSLINNSDKFTNGFVVEYKLKPF